MIKIKELFGSFGSRVNIGCDLGATHIKIVELKKLNGGFSVVACGMIEVPVLQEGGLAAVQRVKSFLKEHGWIGRRAAVNIEDETLKIRRMDLPKMPDGDMKVAIRWNFREHVDGQIEDYVVGYTTMKFHAASPPGKIPLIAFCVSSKSVEERQDIVKRVGLKALSIEPCATALTAAFDAAYGWEPGKFYVLIDFGFKTTNFVVASGGDLLFSRPLSGVSGERLLRLVVKDCGVENGRAKDVLKQFVNWAARGSDSSVSSSPSNGSVSLELLTKVEATVRQFMGFTAVEIQRSIDAFCLMYGVDKVDALFLCGGGSMLPNFCRHLSETLGVEAALLDPFRRVVLGDGIRSKIVNPPQYALAFGLALPR